MRTLFKKITVLLGVGLSLLTSTAYSHSHSHSHSTSSSSCDNTSTFLIYVNEKAHHGGNGTSWEKAFKNLQEALDVAVFRNENNLGPTEIWVAQGTYKPTRTYPENPDLGKTATFLIPANTSIYGGYKGHGCNPNKRNFEKYETILDGDLNNNGLGPDDRIGPNFPLELPQSYLDQVAFNSCHVVSIYSAPNTLLDGLTIANGFAGPDPDVLFARRGGGVFCFDSNGIFRNLRLYNNCAYDATGNETSRGGALFFRLPLDASPKSCDLDNVWMDHSYTNGDASAYNITNAIAKVNGVTVTNSQGVGSTSLMVVGPADNNAFDISNCHYEDNFVCCGCASIAFNVANPLSTVIVQKSKFIHNVSNGNCGSLDIFSTIEVPSSTFLIKCNIFERNEANSVGGYDPLSAVSCGAICDYGISSRVENNKFIRNKGATCGAICIIDYDLNNQPVFTHTTLLQNEFIENTTIDQGFEVSGGAHLIGQSTFGDIIDNTFIKNQSVRNGGGITVENSTANILNNKFCGNIAAGLGSQIYVLNSTVNTNLIKVNCFKKFDDNSVVINNTNFSKFVNNRTTKGKTRTYNIGIK